MVRYVYCLFFFGYCYWQYVVLNWDIKAVNELSYNNELNSAFMLNSVDLHLHVKVHFTWSGTNEKLNIEGWNLKMKCWLHSETSYYCWYIGWVAVLVHVEFLNRRCLVEACLFLYSVCKMALLFWKTEKSAHISRFKNTFSSLLSIVFISSVQLCETSLYKTFYKVKTLNKMTDL